MVRIAQFTLGLLCVAACLTQPATPALAQDNPPPGTSAATPPATGALSVNDALDMLGDEDPATRARALAALEKCTAEDLPVLEAALKNPDTNIRANAQLIIAKVQRGEVAAVVTWKDGTPAAGVTLRVRLDRIPPPHPVDKNTEKALAATGRLTQTETLMQNDFTTDAKGRLSVGQFTDGKYSLDLHTTAGLPLQRQSTTLDLTFGAKPVSWTLQHGVTMAVLVVDEAGQPIEGAACADQSPATFKAYGVQGEPNANGTPAARLRPASLDLAGLPNHVMTDAKGAALLEHILAGQYVGATKKGFQVACAPLPDTLADGGRGDLKLVLKKIPPVDVILACVAPTNQALAGARLLCVPANEIDTVLGPTWPTTISADKFDDYVKQGALNLGATTTTGAGKLHLIPGTYLLVAFPADGAKLLSSVVDVPGPTATTTSLTLTFSDFTAPRLGREPVQQIIHTHDAIAAKDESKK